MSYRPRYKENGVMKDLPLDSETINNFKPYINICTLEDNGTKTAGTWLAKTDKISSLEDGQLFLYKITVAGASTTTLNITGSGGTALGAKNVYRYGTTKLTTQYAVGQYLILVYNTTNTCFRVVNDYDANSYAYLRQYQFGENAAGEANKYPILTRYNLTNKHNSYDTAYSRYYTETYVDTSNGYLYAPKLFSGDSEVALKTDIPTKTSDLTNNSNFVVDASYVHTDNNFTTTYKNAIDANSAKVSNVQADWNATTGLAVILNKPTIPTVNYPVTDVKVNGTSVVSNKIASITVPTAVTESTVAGWGFTKNAGTVTSVSAGTGLSISGTASTTPTVNVASGYKLPTTTEWSGKQNALSTQTAYTTKGSATKVPQITTNFLGQVTSITEVDISAGGTGTVTSVTAGTGLSISGTATVSPKVNIASGYKLPTTTEWNSVLTTGKLSLGTNNDVSGSVVIGSSAKADSYNSDDESYGSDNVVIGSNAQAVNSNDSITQSVVIGKNSSVTSGNSVVIGYDASSIDYQGIAIGTSAKARYISSIAIGYNTNGPTTAFYTRIGSGSYTSTGRALLLGNGSTAFTYMNSSGSSWSSASDIRDKTDIKEIDNALDFINSLKPITYVMNNREDYLYKDKEGKPLLNSEGKQYYDVESHKRGDKKHSRRFAGLSAQDTYQKMIEFYKDDNYADIVDINKYDNPNDEYLEQYSMQYERLVPFLIKAIQEQQEQIDELKKEIEELKK